MDYRKEKASTSHSFEKLATLPQEKTFHKSKLLKINRNSHLN